MSADPTVTATAFAAERTRLLGIAYRMLGSRADAEDVLQDAWLRWSESDNTDVRSAQAWLTTIVTRLSIDRLRSARAQREVYIGPWLPEPLADIDPVTPESKAELASDLSLAFLSLLERLGPDERAAFVLHDAFDCDYDDIAEVLGKSPAACRQLVHRAHERVVAERQRAALAWTEAVTKLENQHVPDAVYDQARAAFSDEELARLTLAVVAINGWNRFNIAFNVPAGSYKAGSLKAMRAQA